MLMYIGMMMDRKIHLPILIRFQPYYTNCNHLARMILLQQYITLGQQHNHLLQV